MAQKAGARRRLKRHRDEQLRVVADAGARRGVGPGMIEDELTLTVRLDIDGAGTDQSPAVPQQQMLRQPAGLRGYTSGFFERCQPPPFQKGQRIAYQRVPRRWINKTKV